MPWLLFAFILLAFLYFRGASIQSTLRENLDNTQSNTAANLPTAQQGTAPQSQYDSLLAAINQGLALANKIADSQVQKH